MKVKQGFLALALLVAFSSTAAAANQVNWGAGQPTTAVGQIKGSGNYTVDKDWQPTSVIMTAIPTGGGMGSSGPGGIPAGGNWGPIALPVMAGQYTVFATITFFNFKTSMFQQINSATSIVNVP